MTTSSSLFYKNGSQRLEESRHPAKDDNFAEH
jgi:hypothetical protein